MKFKSCAILLVASIWVISCQQDKVELIEPQVPVQDGILNQIKDMGFNPEGALKMGDGYLVEGDIMLPGSLFTQTNTNGRTSHISRIQLITPHNVSLIKVWIKSTVTQPGTDNWRTAVRTAINDWNATESAVRFVITENESQADVKVFDDLTPINGQVIPLSDNTIASANISLNGEPGSFVRINLDYKNNQNVNESNKRFTMVHEFGHVLGLSHTDDSIGSGEMRVPGSPVNDAGSVMDSGGWEWNGFSSADLAAIRRLYDRKDFFGFTVNFSHGAGIANLNNLGNNNGFEVIRMAYDGNTDQFNYEIGYDIFNGNSTNGQVPYWTTRRTVSGFGNLEGAGVAGAFIGGSSGIDVVFMGYVDLPQANEFKYKIGYDLKSNGTFNSWSNVKTVQGVGWSGSGADVAITNIGRGLEPDMILMAYDDPSQGNTFRYRIGWDINGSGDAQSWSDQKEIPGVGWLGEGAGIEITSLGADPTMPDLIVVAYDAPSGPNSFRYLIAYDLDEDGNFSIWSNTQQVKGLGDTGGGAGIFLTHLGGSSKPELVLMGYDQTNPGGMFGVRIGWDLNEEGVAEHW